MITIASVEANVGATHLGIMLAGMLTKARYRVGIMECNRLKDFVQIEKAYEGEDFDDSQTDSFKVKGVMYHKDIAPTMLTQMYQYPYDYIICDIGHEFEDYREEILRADIGLFVGQYNDWKRGRYMEFVKDYRTLLTTRSKLLVRDGIREEVLDLKRYSGITTYPIPVQKDPFVKVKENRHSLEKIVGVL